MSILEERVLHELPIFFVLDGHGGRELKEVFFFLILILSFDQRLFFSQTTHDFFKTHDFFFVTRPMTFWEFKKKRLPLGAIPQSGALGFAVTDHLQNCASDGISVSPRRNEIDGTIEPNVGDFVDTNRRHFFELESREFVLSIMNIIRTRLLF